MGAGKTYLAAKPIFCLHKNDALAASCSIVSLRARQILQRFSVAEHAIPGAKPMGTYIDIIYFNPISFASFFARGSTVHKCCTREATEACSSAPWDSDHRESVSSNQQSYIRGRPTLLPLLTPKILGSGTNRRPYHSANVP